MPKRALEIARAAGDGIGVGRAGEGESADNDERAHVLCSAGIRLRSEKATRVPRQVSARQRCAPLDGAVD